MNEIERIEEVMQIIKTRHMLEYMDDDVTQQDIVDYKERFSALKSALTALREQAERSKGCEFCCYTEYPDEKLYPKEGYAFYAGFSKQVDVDAFDEDEVEKISYCPMCGRKLEEAPSDWTKNKACRDAVLKTFGGRA